MHKVVKNGNVAVILSDSDGAGWYTWNRDFQELLFIPTIVNQLETGKTVFDKEELKALISPYVDPNLIYIGKTMQFRLEFVPENTAWKIKEYDGYEELEPIRNAEDFLFF